MMNKATREFKAILYGQRAKGRMKAMKTAYESMKKSTRRIKTLLWVFFFVLGAGASLVFYIYGEKLFF
jgi:hypothetical protein